MQSHVLAILIGGVHKADQHKCAQDIRSKLAGGKCTESPMELDASVRQMAGDPTVRAPADPADYSKGQPGTMEEARGQGMSAKSHTET